LIAIREASFVTNAASINGISGDAVPVTTERAQADNYRQERHGLDLMAAHIPIGEEELAGRLSRGIARWTRGSPKECFAGRLVVIVFPGLA